MHICSLTLVAAFMCAAIPAAGAAEDPKPVGLNELRLYVPIPQLEDRLGKDVKPLADYIKRLEAEAAKVLADQEAVKAKGLLVAVGIKSKSKTRVWCQAVDGEVPAAVLRRLEQELSKVEAVDLKKGPAAFAMELRLFGRTPREFPQFADTWLQAAKEKGVRVLAPPDELFKAIWPD